MTRFVICHSELPAYQLDPSDIIVWNNKDDPPETKLRVISGYNFFQNAQLLHSKVFHAFGIITIVYAIKNEVVSVGHNIEISAYRKFVSKQVVGVEAPNFTGMRLIRPDEFHPELIDRSDRSQRFLVPKMMAFDSIVQQYARAHHLSDLMEYFRFAESGGFFPSSILAYALGTKAMVPGGISLGVFPTEWWLPRAQMICRLNAAIAPGFVLRSPDDPYQMKALSFCSERLESALLIADRDQSGNPTLRSTCHGYMYNVTDEGIYTTARV
jgi:hypothetical protein